MSEIFRPQILGGQVAVVTGGGSGFGRAIAHELASMGASVVICGRRLAPLQETVDLGPANRCTAMVCDIREPAQVDDFVAATLAQHGRIDLLVNNAGGQFLAPAEDITPNGFRSVMRLNVEGTWLMTHAVATKAMIPARSGKVVSITLSPHHGLPGMAHSSAARAAVENLMRVLAIEWARYGILLNAIAAGHFRTDTFMDKYPPEVVEGSAARVPLGRLGRSEEIAWLVGLLATQAGDYTSGSVLTVDGARDNYVGAWPPSNEVGPDGQPLAEKRRATRSTPR